MIPPLKAAAVAALAWSPMTLAAGADSSLSAREEIDWETWLGQFDLHWERMPSSWDEAPFLGNGEQGTQIFQTGPQTIRFTVGCSAAHDHRPAEKDDLAEKHVEVLNRGRHFIGHLELKTSAPLKAGKCRLDLWNAQGQGVLRSEDGELRWRCIVHAEEPVISVAWEATGDLRDSEFHYVPADARSPRAVRAKSPRQPPNPPAKVRRDPAGPDTAVHDLLFGGQTAVAWTVDSAASGDLATRTLHMSVQHSFPEREAEASAIRAVRKASAIPFERWVQTHRAWWHRYYPLSVLSTGDPFWDAFYWIQQYKLGCVTRDGGWIIDNQGPWLQPTAWNAAWWNLNVQTSHAGAYQANRRGQVSALSHALDRHRDHLRLNVAPSYRGDSYALGRSSSSFDLLAHAGQPGGRKPLDPRIGHETGNLLWALHCVDLEARLWADDRLRDDVLYPLLTRAVNYYRHFLREEEDGRLHLPPTHSPELRNVADCSYDLDLLHWGVARLLEIADARSADDPAFEEPLLKTWHDLRERVTPVHVDGTGRMIGRRAPLRGGHRHWSHLLAVYPLRTLRPENPKDRELIETSLSHWRSFGRGIGGYAFTASACMAAILGDGDRALGYLDELKSYLRPNTLYSEIGIPVMETPLHGATAMQEMVLQSSGGVIRAFPAVPGSWSDVQFSRLRGEGGFLVSARLSAKGQSWIEVQAERRSAATIEPGFAIGRVATEDDVLIERQSDGAVSATFSPGTRLLIFESSEPTDDPMIQAVPLRGVPFRFGIPDRSRSNEGD